MPYHHFKDKIVRKRGSTNFNRAPSLMLFTYVAFSELALRSAQDPNRTFALAGQHCNVV